MPKLQGPICVLSFNLGDSGYPVLKKILLEVEAFLTDLPGVPSDKLFLIIG